MTNKTKEQKYNLDYETEIEILKEKLKTQRKELLEDVGVAVVPGLGFGLDGYFRFSFATDEATIIDGINRIEKFVKKYKWDIAYQYIL